MRPTEISVPRSRLMQFFLELPKNWQPWPERPGMVLNCAGPVFAQMGKVPHLPQYPGLFNNCRVREANALGKWWVTHGVKPMRKRLIAFGRVRATHHSAGTSVLHPPYAE